MREDARASPPGSREAAVRRPLWTLRAPEAPPLDSMRGWGLYLKAPWHAFGKPLNAFAAQPPLPRPKIYALMNASCPTYRWVTVALAVKVGQALPSSQPTGLRQLPPAKSLGGIGTLAGYLPHRLAKSKCFPAPYRSAWRNRNTFRPLAVWLGVIERFRSQFSS